MLDSILNVIVAVLAAAACYGAGRTALLGVGVRFGSASAEVALSAGLGFGGLIYAMVALGFAGLYQSATAWGLLAALGIVALLGLWRWPLPTDLAALSSRLRKREWIAVAMASVLAVYGLAYLVVALAPTLEGDSIAGYLLTAREYARNGGSCRSTTRTPTRSPPTGRCSRPSDSCCAGRYSLSSWSSG